MNREMVGADFDMDKTLQNLTVVLIERDLELCSQRLQKERLNLVGGHAAYCSGCKLTLHQCGGDVVSISATASERVNGRHEVTGNVERLLLPIMILKAATSLRSSCICILEVGGAFGHKFKSLIEFLRIVTLIITDVDSVTLLPADYDGDDDELEIEVEAPEVDAANDFHKLLGGNAPAKQAGDITDPAPARRYGKNCLPGVAAAVTSNQTLVRWLPAKLSIDELF